MFWRRYILSKLTHSRQGVFAENMFFNAIVVVARKRNDITRDEEYKMEIAQNSIVFRLPIGKNKVKKGFKLDLSSWQATKLVENVIIQIIEKIGCRVCSRQRLTRKRKAAVFYFPITLV